MTDAPNTYTAARPVAPIEQNGWKAALQGRWVVLALAAGHLLLRQKFAHLSITSLFQIWSEHHLPTELSPRPNWLPGCCDQLYLTELALLLLVPLAFYVWNYGRAYENEAMGGQEEASRRLGLPFLLVLAFWLWGVMHAVAAVALPSGALPELPPGFAAHPIPDWYLIVRQSAVAGYALFCMYTFLFFRNRWHYTSGAAVILTGAAIACAVLDWRGKLGDWTIAGTYFGQETLALAIVAMLIVFAHFNSLIVRTLALFVMAFCGWRETFRFQSGVAVSLGGALLLYAVIGLLALRRGQSRTLKRAAACWVLVLSAAVGYRVLKASTPRAGGPEGVAAKVSSWSPEIYTHLMQVYETTEAPRDPANYTVAKRPPYVPVTDPEVYKLQAAYDATPSVNASDIMWRVFVWRKKLADWYHSRPLIGIGVGQPWFYVALYQTNYHYGEEREGLDPHNGFLNVLHRYGLIGLALLLCAIAMVVAFAVAALRRKVQGDAVLEGLLVYFFYTAVFVFFNNALEGPSYALPFWVSLGLVYARAWQVKFMTLPVRQ